MRSQQTAPRGRDHRLTRIRGYHRPASLDLALELLSRPDVVTAPLGGGTSLNVSAGNGPVEVMDLQGLRLDSITREGPVLTVGATASLQDIADHDWTPPFLRDLARRSAPSTIRAMGTLGGAVASADWEDGLLAGLLATGATVNVASLEGPTSHLMADMMADRSHLRGKIITSVSLNVAGTGTHAATGRTPADTPIVLVAGYRPEGGATVLAATGVATVPIILDIDHIGALEPPGDFRGSPGYRRHLAAVLTRRVLSDLEGSAT